MSALDHVNELYVVMAGHVELVPPSALTATNGDNSNSGGGGAKPNITTMVTTTNTTFGAGGDSLELRSQPYRVISSKQTGGAAQAPSGTSADGNGAANLIGSSADGNAAAGDSRRFPTAATDAELASSSLWQRVGSNSGRSDTAQPHRNRRSGVVLDALPGLRRLQRWWSDLGSASQDWRQGHEQLQREKQSLARASKMVSLSSSSPTPSGRISGVRADAMPAYAMKQLNSRSREPLKYNSVGRSSTTDSVKSAAVQVSHAM